MGLQSLSWHRLLDALEYKENDGIFFSNQYSKHGYDVTWCICQLGVH